MLYIVATPIGNLEDITLRAINTLKACNFIIAENPRYSQRLLQHVGAWPKTMTQFAEHNEKQVAKDLARRLIKEDGCLITDAGTPGISDPGFRLARECTQNNIQVVPLPGANAALAALSASGLPTDKFLFLGFLQKTANKTIRAIQTAKDAEATAIFYESPERILKTLSYISNAFPTSQIVIARELTKIHEEFIRGTPDEVLHELKQRLSIKGEFTVLISFK
ncbi:MAG: 16S rRNA (cytidine(1402)-2'-O)-methyltransferase [Candidatus Doudnabacteria bacterium CG10_big_fil_rev_8_21_14_0_10_42_18]|uniref:Ribosomal RNA small subunit methyltransferase I n=1 Tax=Candidatus Doudnabacteria bacterium CG10_big_fil_rev_8_21_14_0_10_42_18 TaxID=1974552 RepID=A0A2H0VBH0_9BACT|nr:MAG: 16S rRNA (cytidine(1402)-2'-O)-methyltransferase [Candidatus Doudnabacteria bacterium CG10_big_fil_rev_8_21_14_0_10_42_18]